MRHTESTTAECLLVSAMVQALNAQILLILDLMNTLLTSRSKACRKEQLHTSISRTTSAPKQTLANGNQFARLAIKHQR